MKHLKTAIVTGSSSGIGQQMTHVLLSRGYQVYGLARNFDKQTFIHGHYFPVACDLKEEKQMYQTFQHIKEETTSIDILVNNAGVAQFGLHDQLSAEDIMSMVNTNLLAPMLLTRWFLPSLKQSQGTIINVSSITANKISTHGSAYAATKAGLSHFSASLFEEVRKHGVKVICLHPDMTQTPFYDHLSFKEGEDPLSYITAECVAKAVDTILSQRDGTVISELTIRPQKFGITKKK